MTLKTYLFPEVAGHGEITEWVPADVARDLLEAFSDLIYHWESNLNNLDSGLEYESYLLAKEALRKACDK
ncbi:hypothetical protein [uncultured Methylophaga sp.]|uniref:hypothetical protein n=1 Tax=uncultured Methylophaga sp. TaxID=285271 RepID=UPI0030FA0663